MRVALFHNTPSGGAKRAIFEWTKRLSSHHHIDVFTLSTADHGFCDIRPFVKRHRVFDFSPNRLFERPWGRLNQFQRWRDLNHLALTSQKIAEEIDAGDYDITFANTCSFTFTPGILQYIETPSVYYLHEPFGRSFVRTFQRPYLRQDGVRTAANRIDPLIRLYKGRMEKYQSQSVVGASLLLANSLFTQEEMKKSFGIDTPICHYGADCDSFRPELDVRREDFVLSVGELSPRKGFDFLVESLGRISAEKRPPLRLACNRVELLEHEYVQDLAQQQGVELVILADLNTDELRAQYNRARLCVYAPVLEPFGLVPLEAMACGTAVVGVREGGVQESVVDGQTGILVERDPAKFAAAIVHLIDKPELAEAYGRKGREQVLSHWTWDRSVEVLEGLLCECAASHKSKKIG